MPSYIDTVLKEFRELYRFKRRYRKGYVLNVILNFIKANWIKHSV